MREYGLLAGLVALQAADLARSPDFISAFRHTGPGVRSYGAWKTRFDPKINRHTGKPHEHRREIARRARQATGA
jgi:hypothetical protein